MATDNHARWSHRLRTPFWNAAESRLRAFWRVLAALVVVLVGISLLNVLLVRPLDGPLAVKNLLSNSLALAVAVGVLLGWSRYVDRRPLRAYGFSGTRQWWGMVGLGVLVGLLGWGGALVTLLAVGWASISAVISAGTSDLGFLVSFTLFVLGWVCVAVWEELIFRAIVMRNAIEGLDVGAVSTRMAQVGGWVVSAVIFGVLHLDQAASLLALGFWILAGLVLGLAYLLTDELAVPIGLHFAFDFGVNNVFGLASVREVGLAAPTLVRPAFTGPATFIGLSGVVNTGWLVGIGVLTVAVIRWQYGTLELRVGSSQRNGE